MFLLLLACVTDLDGDGVSELLDCDDENPELGALEDDRDCDGFTTDDCDDRDASVNPDAEEVFGDDLDNDCDGVTDLVGASCGAMATLTDPDGTAFDLDLCGDWSWQPLMSFSDLAPGVLAGVELSLAPEEGTGCRLSLRATQLCGEGYYALAELQVSVQSCPGIDDQTTLNEGWLRIDSVRFDQTPTNLENQGFEAAMSGAVGAWGGGWRLDAEFDVASVQDGVHLTDDGCAVSTTGDDDGDGDLALAYGGTDCDDTDPFTFSGAAENDSSSDCMTDADEDGYGDDSPLAEVTPGTDCDDANANHRPEVAEHEPTLCSVDSDEDGWADADANAPLDAGTDCNDEDALEFPGAVTEATNGECMRDADDDGYGDILADGLYDRGSDCNDSDATEFPGAVTEAGSTDCFIDLDDDGYGDAFPPQPYDAGTDCDDSEGGIHIGAASLEPTLCTADADADGYGDADAVSPVEAGTDCIDSRDDIYPGAATLEPTLCAQDTDGDGWAAMSCDAPAAADFGSDCHDGKATIFPGSVTEATNGECMFDWDGDGYGDDAGSSCYDAGTDCLDNIWDDDATFTYTGAAENEPTLCATDEDDDGYGKDSGVATGVEVGTDCDDEDDGAYPGVASIEPTLCTLDDDGDGYGDEDATSPLDAGTDCDDTDAAIYPEALGLELNDGVDADCDGDDSINTPETDIDGYGYEFDALTSGSADAAIGFVVTVGDWDNDGFDDLYLGATDSSQQGFIVTGPISGWDMDVYNAPTDHADITSYGADFGDLDGDGNTDFAVRGRSGPYPDYDYGSIWLGPVTGTLDPSNRDFAMDHGGQKCVSWNLGAYDDEDVRIGDLDGDGQDDLVVGHPTWNSVCNGGLGLWNGAVSVVYGPITADVGLDSADLILTGNGYPDMFGRHPDIVDDLDGDGVDDLVTGSSRSKSVHIMTDVPSLTSGYLDDEATLTLTYTYRTVAAGAGDWDGDGYGDLVVGSSNTGDILLGGSTLTSTPTASFSASSSSFGVAVAGDGDFNGDGLDDVAFHAYDTAYLVYGGVSGTLDADSDGDAVFEWTNVDSAFAEDGRPLEFGDFDHDGLDDLVIGVPAQTTSSMRWYGGAVVILGQ